MRNFLLIIMAILVLAICSAAYAATTGSCEAYKYDGHKGARICVWEWTSDASGDGSGDDFEIENVGGYITSVQFRPDTTDIPTDDYDVTITDEQGIDVIYGKGTDIDKDPDDSENIRMPLTPDGDRPFISQQTLSLTVSSAGNAKSGTVILVLE